MYSKEQHEKLLGELYMQARLEWVDIDRVIPNPKNPRRDHSIQTEDMQGIINSKGWEEVITCYQSGHYNVILSGHRRWYAARKMGEQEVPIFIVSAPENEAEELDRLGSVQGGQEDWSPYEWAKYTYDMWENLNEMTYEELAKRLGVSQGIITARIRVYKYYPRIWIEDKLENGMYSIAMLDYIYSWIKKLIKYQPELVKTMNEERIKQQMLKKYENKCFNSRIVSDKVFVMEASTSEIIDFLTDITKKLSDCQMEIVMRGQTKQKDIIQNSMEITATINDLKKIECRTTNEAQRLIEELQKLFDEVDKRVIYINNFTKTNDGCE